MSKKEVTTIDALFGSKTRVKLLYLFLNNPGKAFYVREITRLIDEQINSVRRELSNLLNVGVITSDTADNKLYYEINQRYEFYAPFRSIFAGETTSPETKAKTSAARATKRGSWQTELEVLGELRVAVAAGILVKGSASAVDLVLVGDLPPQKVKKVIETIEKDISRPLNYTVMKYEEFYYRLSVRDRFVSEVLSSKHEVVVDSDGVITSK